MYEMGLRIKQLRKANHLTQEDLATFIGYSDRSMIARIESGDVDIPASKLDGIAFALNTTPMYILRGNEDESESLSVMADDTLTASVLLSVTKLTTEQKKLVQAFISGVVASSDK